MKVGNRDHTGSATGPSLGYLAVRVRKALRGDWGKGPNWELDWAVAAVFGSAGEEGASWKMGSGAKLGA